MPSDSQRHDTLERATELCVGRGLCVFDSPEAMIEFFDLQDVMRLPLGGAAGIVASLKLKQKREEAALSRRRERRRLRRQQEQRQNSDESTPQTPDDNHDDDDHDEGGDDHQSPLLRSSTTALVTCDQDEASKTPHKDSPPSTEPETFGSQKLRVVDRKDPYAGGREDHDEDEEGDATTWWRPYFVSAALPSLRDEELAAVCGAMIPTTTTTTTATDPKLFKRGAAVEGPMPFYLSSMWRSANTATTDRSDSTSCKGSPTTSLSTTTGRIVLLPFAFAGAALYVSVATVANMINTAVVAPVVWSAEKSAGLASWVGDGYRRRWGSRNDPFSLQGKKGRKKKKAVAHRQREKRTKGDRSRRGWSQRDEERVLLIKYRVGEVEQLSEWLFDEHEGEEGSIRTGPNTASPTSETDEEYASSEVLSDQSTSHDGSPLNSSVPSLGAMDGLHQANGNGLSPHTIGVDYGLISPSSPGFLRPCEKWGARRHQHGQDGQAQHGQQRSDQQQEQQLNDNDKDGSSNSNSTETDTNTDTDTDDSGADSLETEEEETEGKAYRLIGTAPQIYSSSNLPCCQCRCTCGKSKVTPRKPEVTREPLRLEAGEEKRSGAPTKGETGGNHAVIHAEGVNGASTDKTAELSAAAESAAVTKEEGGAQQGPLSSFPSLNTAAGLVTSFAFSVVDVTRKIVDHVAPTQLRHQSNTDDTHAKRDTHNNDGHCKECCRCLPSASTTAANKRDQSTRVSDKRAENNTWRPSEDNGGMGSSGATETGRGTGGIGVDRVIFIPAMQRLSAKVLEKLLPSLARQEHGAQLAVDRCLSAPQSQEDARIAGENSVASSGGRGGDLPLTENVLPAFSRVFTLDEWIDLLLSLQIKSGEAVTEHLVLTQHLIVFDVDMVIGVLPNKKRGKNTSEKSNTILLESTVRSELAPQHVNDESELPSGTSPNATPAPSSPSSSCLLASSSDTALHRDDDSTARVRVRTLKALYFPLPKGFGRSPLHMEQPQDNKPVAASDDDESLSDAKALAAWKYLAHNLSLQVGFWEEALEQALAMSRGLDEEEGILESSLHQLREQQQHAPNENNDTNAIGQMTKDHAKKRAKEISEKLSDIVKTKATVQRDIDVLSRRIAENKLVAIECEKLRNRLSSSTPSSSSSRPVSLRDAVVRVEELMNNFGDGPWPRL